MKHVSWLAALAPAGSPGSAWAADAPESRDDLVQVKPRRMDAAAGLGASSWTSSTAA